MASQLPLRPNNSGFVTAGTYNFTFEEVKLIYKLYTDDNFTLWEIKESSFNEAQLQEIAVAINHGEWDKQKLTYDQRLPFSYDPGLIDLTNFWVGRSSH